MMMKKMMKHLLIAFILILSVNSCKKDPGIPCGPVGQICCATMQGEHSSSKIASPSSLKITWSDKAEQSSRKQSYTIILTDIKTKKVFFIGSTNAKSIIVPIIPKNSFNIKVITHPCDVMADIDVQEIIVGDIQCFRPGNRP